jgi:Ca-activated chloride channel homolog
MYYIENADQAASIFGDELQDILDLGAQNVTVSVQPAPAAQLTTVHHDYPRSAAGTLLKLQLGDIYAREPKPVLIELLVTGDVVGDTAVVELVVSGDVLTADGGVERQVITLPVTLAADESARVDPDVRKEMLLLAAARARNEALEKRERGDFDGAVNVLRATGRRLRCASIDDAQLAEHAADLAVMSESFAAREVSAADQKYMYQRAYNARRGRSMKDELIRRETLKEEEEEEEEPPEA